MLIEFGFVISAVFVTSALASAMPSNPFVSSYNLVSRAVPAACEDLCNPTETAIAACGNSATCICTNPVADDIAYCSGCLVDENPSLLLDLQNAWSRYLVDCCQAGVCVVIDYGPIPPGSVYAVSSTTLVVTRATPTLASIVALPVFSDLPSAITSGVAPVTSGVTTSSAESASGTAAGAGNGGGPGLASFSRRNLSIGDIGSLAIAALGAAFICSSLL